MTFEFRRLDARAYLATPVLARPVSRGLGFAPKALDFCLESNGSRGRVRHRLEPPGTLDLCLESGRLESCAELITLDAKPRFSLVGAPQLFAQLRYGCFVAG